MAEIRLPLSITYETEGTTPIADVIEALAAVDALTEDAVALMPSLIGGVRIEKHSVNVQSLTQGSPLREVFFISIFLAFQEELEREVPMLAEELFNLNVSDKFETLLTVALLAVAFYGVSIAIDVAKKTFSDSLPRAKFEELIQLLASETGKPASDIRKIIEARFGKPSAVRRLVSFSKKLFTPSQKDKNAPVVFDRDRVTSDVIREIPYQGDSDQQTDYDRYTPYEGVALELHAQGHLEKLP